jgi:hypothetical protein
MSRHTASKRKPRFGGVFLLPPSKVTKAAVARQDAAGATRNVWSNLDAWKNNTVARKCQVMRRWNTPSQMGLTMSVVAVIIEARKRR